MTRAEIDAWWRANRTIRNIERAAQSPCEDCSRRFAETMRLVGRSDGTWPGEDGAPEGFGKRGSGQWAYATETERIAARRATWRESSRRMRAMA